jgi:uncharacterized membrane protein
MREVMLFVHFIGLTMGVGTAFAHAFLGLVTSKMVAEEATKFRVHSLVLSRMGNTGLVLLVISGLYLITPFWKTLPSTPLLMLKLALVSLLAVLIIVINVFSGKAKKGDAEEQLKKIELLGKLTLPLSIIIVILAVSIFH